MRMKCPQRLKLRPLKKRQHQPDAAAAQRKPFLMPIRKSGHWKRRQLWKSGKPSPATWGNTKLAIKAAFDHFAAVYRAAFLSQGVCLLVT
jgi:hypothetical protein